MGAVLKAAWQVLNSDWYGLPWAPAVYAAVNLSAAACALRWGLATPSVGLAIGGVANLALGIIHVRKQYQRRRSVSHDL